MENKTVNYETEKRRDNNDFKFYSYIMPETEINKQLVEPHWHSEMELVYSETYGILYVNDKAYEMTPGSMFFVSPKAVHRTFRKEHGVMIHTVFDLNFLKTVTGDNVCNRLLDDVMHQNRKFKEIVPIGSELYEELLPIVNRIHTYVERTVCCGYESCEVTSLLFSLLAATMKANHFELINEYYLYGMQYVVDTISYIDEHYHENLTVSDLAKNANVSTTYLYRLFHDYVGTTPINYINSVRLRAAYRLLEKECNVTETAMAVGIQNVSYFIKLFKSATGETPRSWLKERRINE